MKGIQGETEGHDVLWYKMTQADMLFVSSGTIPASGPGLFVPRIRAPCLWSSNTGMGVPVCNPACVSRFGRDMRRCSDPGDDPAIPRNTTLPVIQLHMAAL